jgi:hypothetical protein
MDPSGAPVFIRGFSGVRVAQSLVFTNSGSTQHKQVVIITVKLE